MHLAQLAIGAVLAVCGADFEPSHEWQVVLPDEKIPGGLEIRLDMETGEKFARLPPGSAQADKPGEDSNEHGSNLVAVPIDTSQLDLDVLEDMAHDVKHGSDVLQSYYPALIALVQDDSASPERRDHAGKVIGVALRSNPLAARTLATQDKNQTPGSRLFEALGLLGASPSPSARSIMVLTGLASTEQGLRAFASELKEVRGNFAHIRWTPESARKLKGLTEDIALIDKDQIGEWVSALEAAIPATDDNTRLEMLKVLVAVFGQEDAFKDVPKPQASREFYTFLANEPGRKPRARSEDSGASEAWLKYVKKVVHTFGNPKAARVHFEDL